MLFLMIPKFQTETIFLNKLMSQKTLLQVILKTFLTSAEIWDQSNFEYILQCRKFYQNATSMITWDKVFKNGPSKTCGRQPLKSLKAAFHKFYLVHSWIICHICKTSCKYLAFTSPIFCDFCVGFADVSKHNLGWVTLKNVFINGFYIYKWFHNGFCKIC